MPTNRARRYKIESTGIPAPVLGQHQRTFDRVAADLDGVQESVDGLSAGKIAVGDAAADAYTPGDPATWDTTTDYSEVPATIQVALDRIAKQLSDMGQEP